MLGHSEAADSPALHPPGCPLRAYGCRACRATTTTAAAAAAAAAAATSYNTSTSNGIGASRSASSRYSYEAAAAAAAAAAATAATASPTSTEGDELGDITEPIGRSSGSSGDATRSAGRGSAELYSYAAAAAAAGETAESATPNAAGADGGDDSSTGTEDVQQDRAGGHNNPGVCPWYRVQCKSCEQEVRIHARGWMRLVCVGGSLLHLFLSPWPPFLRDPKSSDRVLLVVDRPRGAHIEPRLK